VNQQNEPEKSKFTPENLPSITPPDHDQVVIKYPKQPFEIGKIVEDGNLKPIWVDPKDFIRTGEQNDHLAHNIKFGKLQAAMETARRDIAARVEAWLARVMKGIAPVTALADSEKLSAWLRDNDINYIEDTSVKGLHKFKLRRGQVIISEFTAELKLVDASDHSTN
jgi:hypothetical protein